MSRRRRDDNVDDSTSCSHDEKDDGEAERIPCKGVTFQETKECLDAVIRSLVSASDNSNTTNSNNAISVVMEACSKLHPYLHECRLCATYFVDHGGMDLLISLIKASETWNNDELFALLSSLNDLTCVLDDSNVDRSIGEDSALVQRLFFALQQSHRVTATATTIPMVYDDQDDKDDELPLAALKLLYNLCLSSSVLRHSIASSPSYMAALAQTMKEFGHAYNNDKNTMEILVTVSSLIHTVGEDGVSSVQAMLRHHNNDDNNSLIKALLRMLQQHQDDGLDQLFEWSISVISQWAPVVGDVLIAQYNVLDIILCTLLQCQQRPPSKGNKNNNNNNSEQVEEECIKAFWKLAQHSSNLQRILSHQYTHNGNDDNGNENPKKRRADNTGTSRGTSTTVGVVDSVLTAMIQSNVNDDCQEYACCFWLEVLPDMMQGSDNYHGQQQSVMKDLAWHVSFVMQYTTVPDVRTKAQQVDRVLKQPSQQYHTPLRRGFLGVLARDS